MNWFVGIEDRKLIDSRYRELVKKFHPDVKGGDHELFIKLKVAYDKRIEELSNKKESIPVYKYRPDYEYYIDGLIDIKNSKGYKGMWVYYSLLKNYKKEEITLDMMKYLANELGYKTAWAIIKFKELNEV